LLIWWALPQAGAGQSVPGQVLSAGPLTVACGGGALKVSEWQWHGDIPRRDDTHGLSRGKVLGAPAGVNVQGA